MKVWNCSCGWSGTGSEGSGTHACPAKSVSITTYGTIEVIPNLSIGTLRDAVNEAVKRIQKADFA